MVARGAPKGWEHWILPRGAASLTTSVKEISRILPLGVERGVASRSELSTDRQSRSARSPDGAGEGPAGDRAARGGAGEGMVGSGVEGVAAEVAAGGWWSGSYGGTPSCPLAQL